MRALEHALRVQAARDLIRRRKKAPKMPRPRYPTNERLYYFGQLLHMVETVQWIVRRDVLPKLPALLAAHAAVRPHMDAGPQPREPKGSPRGGRWTAAGSVTSARQGFQAARAAHKAAPTAQTRAARSASFARVKQRRALAARVGASDRGRFAGTLPQASAPERSAFLAPHKAALGAARSAHAANPGKRTERQLHEAKAGLRDARKRAGSADHDARTAEATVTKRQQHMEMIRGEERTGYVPAAGDVPTRDLLARAEHQLLDAHLQHSTPGTYAAATVEIFHYHTSNHKLAEQYKQVNTEERVQHQATRSEAHRAARGALHDHVNELASELPVTLSDHPKIQPAEARTIARRARTAAMGRANGVASAFKKYGAVRADASESRYDAADTDIDELFAAVGETARREIPEQAITLAVQQSALRTSRWNANELAKEVQKVAKVNIFDDSTGLGQHLDLFVSDNVRLVKSLAFDQLDDLKGIVTRAARAGLHHTDVAQQIEQRFGMTKDRAALIATDQLGKLNGELNQLRQQTIGVRRYRWSSSQDERVRSLHRRLNGQIFEWRNPPVIDERTGQRGHPGQAVRCRCAPIPIIDDVLVDAGLMDPADVELTHPTAGPQRTLRPVVMSASLTPPQPPIPPMPPANVNHPPPPARPPGGGGGGGRPRSPANRAVLTGLRTEVGAHAGGNAGAGGRARSLVRGVLRRLGLQRTPGQTRAHSLTVMSAPGGDFDNLGFLHPSGALDLRDDVYGALRQALDDIATGAPLSDEGLSAVATMLHEEAHGMGVAIPGVALKRVGLFVDEGVSEILARRSARELLEGDALGRSMLELPQHVAGAWIMNAARAYDDVIVGILTELQQITAWPDQRVLEALEQAAVGFKLQRLALPNHLMIAIAFVKAIPGLDIAQRGALVGALFQRAKNY